MKLPDKNLRSGDVSWVAAIFFQVCKAMIRLRPGGEEVAIGGCLAGGLGKDEAIAGFAVDVLAATVWVS